MDYVLGLGPGFTDRLSRTLRDRDGLAYSVWASMAGSASGAVGALDAQATSRRVRVHMRAG